ncbi:MAG: hypothetical protein AAB727_00815 [Patescibacteria group bacterium]
MKQYKNYFITGIVVVILAVAFVADLVAFQKNGGHKDATERGEAEARVVEKARAWVLEESPTYRFDGSGLAFVSSEPLEGGGERVSFSFESSHGGYGDRTELIVTQVITAHVIIIDIKDGAVIRAIIDGKFNEITGALGE